MTWVFFRAETFESAWFMVKSMLGLDGHLSESLLTGMVTLGAGFIVVAMLCINWLLRDTSLEGVASKTPAWLKPIILSAMWYAIILAPGERVAFIYFQF